MNTMSNTNTNTSALTLSHGVDHTTVSAKGTLCDVDFECELTNVVPELAELAACLLLELYAGTSYTEALETCDDELSEVETCDVAEALGREPHEAELAMVSRVHRELEAALLESVRNSRSNDELAVELASWEKR